MGLARHAAVRHAFAWHVGGSSAQALRRTGVACRCGAWCGVALAPVPAMTLPIGLLPGLINFLAQHFLIKS